MNWTTFLIGCVLWITWGFATAKMGITVNGEHAGDFWVLWGITLIMMLFYSNKHHFEKK